MNKRKKKLSILLCGSLILLISSLCINIILSFNYSQKQYKVTSDFAEWMIEEYPEDEQKIIKYIKEYDSTIKSSEQRRLEQYGFNKIEFLKPYKNMVISSSVSCIVLLVTLIVFVIYLMKTRAKSRIQSITDYLVNANIGKDVTVFINFN